MAATTKKIGLDNNDGDILNLNVLNASSPSPSGGGRVLSVGTGGDVSLGYNLFVIF